MQRRVQVFLMLAVSPVACLMLGGCVVAPPRARVVAVAPAQVWVPAHGTGEVWSLALALRNQRTGPKAASL